MFRSFADALEWALDATRQLAREYPDEVAAVERVRAFIRKRIAGDPAHVRVDDLLFVFGLVAGVVEKAFANRATVVPMAMPRAIPSGSVAPKRLPMLPARRQLTR